MRKLMFSTAAILALSLSAFAGTPETKGETKPEAKTETKTNDPLVYHYTGKTLDGKIEFAEGPAPECPTSGNVPCEWEASAPMTSPQTEAYINTNASEILQTRGN